MTKYLGSRKKPETDLLQDTQEENAYREQTHRMVGGSALTMATEMLIANMQADTHPFTFIIIVVVCVVVDAAVIINEA